MANGFSLVRDMCKKDPHQLVKKGAAVNGFSSVVQRPLPDGRSELLWPGDTLGGDAK